MKITIDIWSDFACPFCYIGKRRLMAALDKHPEMEVKLVWHSYQLDPGLQFEPGRTINQLLAAKKGISLEEADQMNQYVSQMGAESGITMHMDRIIPANTFSAHKLLQYATQRHLQNEISEKLFAAYFTEGKNIAEPETLVQVGEAAGLGKEEILAALEDEEPGALIKKDIGKAAELGIRGVPFFVFNWKFAVSGAQPAEVFEQALQRAAE